MYRVTQRLTVDSALRHSQQHHQRLAKLQRELSTGLRLHRPSDDPAAVERALGLKLEDARYTSDLTAIEHVESALNQSVTHLLETRTILTRARAIAVDASQPDGSALRDVHVRELEELLDRLLSLANAADGDRYLFGGARASGAPFERSGDVVEYVGDELRSSVPIGRHRQFDVLYAGSEIFASRERGETLVEGITGARAAAGTDNGVGRAVLTVRHTGTSYAAGSGLSQGTSSVGGDNVLGAAGTHVITIDDTSGVGASGVLSLNGGEPVAWTNADTDLEVRDGQGRVVFVDTTSITAGFSGNVDVTGAGTLSMDGGLTETVIDFSSSQTLTDSLTGRVTRIDSSGITQADEDDVEYTGTFNVFSAVIALRDDLKSASTRSDAEVSSLASRRALEFERHTDKVLEIVGEQSATLETLEQLKQQTASLRLEARSALSAVEGANLAEAAIGLQNEQQLLEMTYGSLARLFDLNLFNFLQ